MVWDLNVDSSNTNNLGWKFAKLCKCSGKTDKWATLAEVSIANNWQNMELIYLLIFKSCVQEFTGIV